MPDVTVNYLAVVVATLLGGVVLGFLWYGPLFEKPWRKLVGIDSKETDEEAKKEMGKALVISTLGSLIMAYILAHIIGYTNATTVVQGLQVGFWMWLGFIATSMLNGVLFEKKPIKLYQIDAGFQLIELLVMGVILAIWR